MTNSSAGYDEASLIDDFFRSDDSEPVIDHLVDVRVGWSAALNLRLGYKFSDRFGFYALAGLDATRLKIYVPDLMAGTHQDVHTFQLGGGFQYALTDHLFTRLQYTFTNLRDPNFLFTADGRTRFLAHPVNHMHRVMLGIGYAF
jgi:outer membrane immunogenic protein